MLDPSSLFQPSEHVDPTSPGRFLDEQPILLVTLGAHGDAGESQALIDDHLLEQFANHKLGRFDVDQLLDYTGDRPMVIFDRDHFRGYEAPEINLHHITDDSGRPFLLLSGPEPDLQWERMAAAIEQVIDTFGVDRTVLLQSFPAPAPHTRPVHVSAFASDPSLLGAHDGIPATFKLGAGFTSLLTLRLGEHGKQVLGLVAHVPHYVADSEYPDAAIALLASTERATELDLPITGRLEQAARLTKQIIQQQVDDSEEARQIVAQLEEQYDRWISQRQLTTRTEVPTADEIGAEVEEFLKGLGDEGAGPGDPPVEPRLN